VRNAPHLELYSQTVSAVGSTSRGKPQYFQITNFNYIAAGDSQMYVYNALYTDYILIPS
jgi:hypothetical protein